MSLVLTVVNYRLVHKNPGDTPTHHLLVTSLCRENLDLLVSLLRPQNRARAYPRGRFQSTRKQCHSAIQSTDRVQRCDAGGTLETEINGTRNRRYYHGFSPSQQTTVCSFPSPRIYWKESIFTRRFWDLRLGGRAGPAREQKIPFENLTENYHSCLRDGDSFLEKSDRYAPITMHHLLHRVAQPRLISSTIARNLCTPSSSRIS